VCRFPHCNLCAIEAAQTGTIRIRMNSLSESILWFKNDHNLGIFIFPIYVYFLCILISNVVQYGAKHPDKLSEFPTKYHHFRAVWLLHTHIP